MRSWLTLLIFLLEAWALVTVHGSRKPARSKIGWTLAIILLPVVGMLAWFGRGQHSPMRAHEAS